MQHGDALLRKCLAVCNNYIYVGWDMKLILNAGITIYSHWRASSFCVCCLCVIEVSAASTGKWQTASHCHSVVLDPATLSCIPLLGSPPSSPPTSFMFCILLSRVWHVSAKCRQPPTQIAVWSQDTFCA